MRNFLSSIFAAPVSSLNFMDTHLVARFRSIIFNGGEKPIQSGAQSVRIDWDHYGRVLEAKKNREQNS